MSSLQSYPGGYYTWFRYDSASKVDLWSTLVVRDGMWIVIDPTILPEKEMLELKKLGQPQAILLTSGNHERASEAWQEKFQIPIGTSAEALIRLKRKPDFFFKEGSEVYDFLPICIFGAGPGEMAFYDKKMRTAVVGDCIVNLDMMPFSLLPDKYCQDPRLMRKALKTLLNFDIARFFFAHGQPVLKETSQKLRELL